MCIMMGIISEIRNELQKIGDLFAHKAVDLD